MSRVTLDHPWLEFDLGGPMQVLSWSLNRPGCVSARRILWREVRDGDLTRDLDVDAWLDTALQARGARDAIVMLTSCDIGGFTEETVRIGRTEARAVVTLGLTNAERVGTRRATPGTGWGTINVALRLDTGLSEAGLLEAMSIAVEARTVAVMEAGLALSGVGLATGTGTDCMAVASPAGTARFAGLHTEIGEAAGRAVHAAVSRAAKAWKADGPNGMNIAFRDRDLAQNCITREE